MRDLRSEDIPSFDPTSHIVIPPPHPRPKGASGLVLHMERLNCGRLLVPGTSTYSTHTSWNKCMEVRLYSG